MPPASSWEDAKRLHRANVILGGALDTTKARIGMVEADTSNVVVQRTTTLVRAADVRRP